MDFSTVIAVGGGTVAIASGFADAVRFGGSSASCGSSSIGGA